MFQHALEFRTARRRCVAVAVAALVAASCGSDESSSDASAPGTDGSIPSPSGPQTETSAPDTTAVPEEDSEGEEAAPATSDVAVETSEVPAETTADTAPPSTEADSAPEAEGEAWASAFPGLPAPSGEEIAVGLVNTEGAPGLDFPEIRTYVGATVDYLNEHGGIGDRPIRLETCTTAGSPESSQACAQELTGKGVELVVIGLDVFTDYATYQAASMPLIGMVPILPTDNTAEARFLSGGNASVMGAMTAVANDYFAATKVGIVSADNPGANASEAALTASLDLAGIEHFTVKGGDNETDAGYQGLMRQADEGDADLLISLYSDAGCIGTIRGRAALGIETPVLTTSICAGGEIIQQVGDDAIGWYFVGTGTQEQTPEIAILQDALAPALGVPSAEVDTTALGLGGVGAVTMLSIAGYGNLMVEAGEPVSGQGLYDFIGESDDLTYWPGDIEIECGAAASYPAICAFSFPVATYTEAGAIVTVDGLDAVSSIPYLP